MKNVVLKLDLHDNEVRRKAMKIASRLSGVNSLSLDKDQKLTVIGDIDPVVAVRKLRKLCHAEIVSVGPAREPEKKKEEAKKRAELKKDYPYSSILERLSTIIASQQKSIAYSRMMDQEHVSVILKRLSSIIANESSWRELNEMIGLEGGTEELLKGLLDIHSVPDDVGELDLSDIILRNWLDAAQAIDEVLYDIEDLLDDFNTRLGKLQIDAVEWQRCKLQISAAEEVQSSISAFEYLPIWPFNIQGKQSMPSERRQTKTLLVKNLMRRVAEFEKQKAVAEVNKVNKGLYKDTSSHDMEVNLGETVIKELNLIQRPSKLSMRTKLYGLDEVKEEIMGILLADTSEGRSGNIKTISIVGMEVMGRTSLAQSICNDDKVLASFENIIWVNVLESFHLGKIARSIIQSLEGLEQDYLWLLALAPLQSLLARIHRKILKRKSLLILDDVDIYNNDDWETLKALFKRGMSGSRILVTARKHSVAIAMESSHVFHLKELSDEVCWIILRQVAFVGLNEDSHGNLEDIGRKLAEKCKGSPFTARVLGGVLQHKTERKDWLSVLENEIWESSVTRKYIFKSLWLCFYDLPSAVRRCLLYCAIFPRNFEMSKTLLIQHWMAQGYLNSTNDSQMELKGEEYFKCLVAHSFFQDFSKCRDDGMDTCKMHGMVHDFVRSLFQYEYMIEMKSVETAVLDLSARKLEEAKPVETSMLALSSNSVYYSPSVRHLVLMIAQGVDFPVDIVGAKKLRSLIAVSEGSLITSQALRNLFNRSKHLRLLDLSLTSGWHNCFGPCGPGNVLPEFPEEICQLINLRYLNLAGSKEMKILPETLCELLNLQSLDLTGCSGLTKLPDGMGKLVNLRYLCTWQCSSVAFYPKGIGSLTSLRELTNVIVRADCNDVKEFSLGDLEKLEHLSGHLRVKLVGNAIDAGEARRANLWNKKHLNNIKINLVGHTREDVVIEELNPPSSLKIEFIDWWF